MRVLALDTTTRAGSVALVVDDRVVEERGGDPSRSHAERLPGEVMTILKDCDVDLSEIDVFAVASGPGSLTGLRIGIATVQGLAFVGRRRVVGISALEALAQAGSVGVAPESTVAAWMDARRREVFSALYRVGSADAFTTKRLEEVEPAAVGDPGVTLGRWAHLGARPAMCVGDGAVLYGDLIGRSGFPRTAIVSPPPLAGAIGRLAVAYARRGDAVDPADIRPLYVRRPDAETARAARS